MTVEQLIKQLKQLPPSKEVIIRLDNDGIFSSKIDYLVSKEYGEDGYVVIVPKGTLPTPEEQIEIMGV